MGSNITVVVTAENETTNTMRNVHLSGGMSASGTGKVSLVTDGSTGVSATLTPGQSASFTNVYQGTNAGKVTFNATVQATSPGGSISATFSIPLVAIVPGGDLLIKRSVASSYAGGGRLSASSHRPAGGDERRGRADRDLAVPDPNL